MSISDRCGSAAGATCSNQESVNSGTQAHLDLRHNEHGSLRSGTARRVRARSLGRQVVSPGWQFGKENVEHTTNPGTARYWCQDKGGSTAQIVVRALGVVQGRATRHEILEGSLFDRIASWHNIRALSGEGPTPRHDGGGWIGGTYNKYPTTNISWVEPPFQKGAKDKRSRYPRLLPQIRSRHLANEHQEAGYGEWPLQCQTRAIRWAW